MALAADERPRRRPAQPEAARRPCGRRATASCEGRAREAARATACAAVTRPRRRTGRSASAGGAPARAALRTMRMRLGRRDVAAGDAQLATIASGELVGDRVERAVRAQTPAVAASNQSPSRSGSQPQRNGSPRPATTTTRRAGSGQVAEQRARQVVEHQARPRPAERPHGRERRLDRGRRTGTWSRPPTGRASPRPVEPARLELAPAARRSRRSRSPRPRRSRPRRDADLAEHRPLAAPGSPGRSTSQPGHRRRPARREARAARQS